MPPVVYSSLLAVLAGGSLILGATIPASRTRFFDHHLSLLIGFSAGLMLATALHELLPQALATEPRLAVWGAAAGFLSLYVAERLTHFHACRHRQCEIEAEATASAAPLPVHVHNHGPGTVRGRLPLTHAHADFPALVGMSIHNFADGLTTAAAFSVSATAGIVVLMAIMLHQAAAGMSLGAILIRAGRVRRRVLISTAVVAAFILWGALFYHLIVPRGSAVQGIILGLAGGSFLYVAACDLLPEAHAEDEGWSVTAMTLAGYLFALGLCHI